MKIVDIANEIYIDNGSQSDTSIPAISFWIRGKIGALNTLLYEDFTYDTNTLEVTNGGGELSYDAIAIIKQMYRVYDCDLQVRKQMNALDGNSILKWQDQGTEVIRINRNSVSQTYVMLRKQEMGLLMDMVTAYRNKSSAPSQIAGDDTIAGFITLYPVSPAYMRR